MKKLQKFDVMKSRILDALRAKYRGEMEFHRMNIDIYLKNPVGIGEHPDVLGAIDAEVEALAAVTEKLQTLLTEYPED